MIVCAHCGAEHDGTARALDLHPSAPHARPMASIFVHRDDRPHSWYYAVGRYHSGYAYDEWCAGRAARAELVRLGITEIRP